MRSYVKILGPPTLDSLKELEKIAVEMPNVCITEESGTIDLPPSVGRDLGETFEYNENLYGHLSRRTGTRIIGETYVNMISESKVALGEYDFFFEWFQTPSGEQLEELIGKIDDALTPLGCLYSITTKP